MPGACLSLSTHPLEPQSAAKAHLSASLLTEALPPPPLTIDWRACAWLAGQGDLRVGQHRPQAEQGGEWRPTPNGPTPHTGARRESPSHPRGQGGGWGLHWHRCLPPVATGRRQVPGGPPRGVKEHHDVADGGDSGCTHRGARAVSIHGHVGGRLRLSDEIFGRGGGILVCASYVEWRRA